MKKNYLVVLLFLMAIFNSGAQISPIEINKSKISKDKKKVSELVFSSQDDNGGVVLVRSYSSGFISKTPKGYLIEHYDAGLNLLKQEEIEIDHSSIKNMFVKDGKVHLIEYKRDLKNKKDNYNLLTADLADLSFDKETIFSMDRKKSRTPFYFSVGFVPFTNKNKIDHDPTGEVVLSENKEYITFNFDLNDKNESHLVKVYNSNLEKVFEKELKEDIKDQLFVYNTITTSNDGDVYFLGKAFENTRATRKKGKANYTYKIYKLDESGIKQTTFDTDENFVSSLEMLSKNGNLACVGFYSERNDNLYKGTIYFSLDPEDLTIKKSSFNPFTEQFMVDKYGEKRGKRVKKRGKELRNLVYRGMFMDDEGGVYFNAEEYYITVTSSGGMGAARTQQTIYHYNDIIACKINADGKMAWARNISKKQASGGDTNYLSYIATQHDNHMVLLLNGPKKIKTRRDDRIIIKNVGTKRMSLYAIDIQPDGEFDFKKLITHDDSKMSYKVREGVVSKSEDNIFIEGNRGKKKQVIKLTL